MGLDPAVQLGTLGWADVRLVVSTPRLFQAMELAPHALIRCAGSQVPRAHGPVHSGACETADFVSGFNRKPVNGLFASLDQVTFTCAFVHWRAFRRRTHRTWPD